MPLGESALMRIISSNETFDVYVKPCYNYGMVEPAVYEMKSGAILMDPNSRQALEFKFNWSSKVKRLNSLAWRFSPGRGYILFLYSADVGYGLFSAKGRVYSVPSEAFPAATGYWGSLVKNMSIRPPAWAERAFLTSALVHARLIYRPSGAIISSPTTSLP